MKKRLWSYVRSELNNSFLEYAVALAFVVVIVYTLMDILSMATPHRHGDKPDSSEALTMSQGHEI